MIYQYNYRDEDLPQGQFAGVKMGKGSAIFSRMFFIGLPLLLMLLTGCGGGGGGASSTGTSPEELEVQAVLDAFSSSVRAGNLAATMANFDTNLKYYPANPALPGGFEDYLKFRERLDAFFQGVTITEFSLTSNGISAGMEDVAMARAQLRCVYIQGATTKEINEPIEMKLERVSKWGIIEMYQYDSLVGQTGMSFPPKL
jgi:hypothetical protein